VAAEWLDGIDPIEARESARRTAEASGITFRRAFETFFATKRKSLSNEKHAAQWQSTMETYVFPTIGNRPVPPKAMARFAWKDRTLLVTIGVAVRPQPDVEMATESPELLRRIELGAALPDNWSEEAVQGFGKYLSNQSTCPGTTTRGSVRDTR
jgi:hypothetical protein